jgi:16S rRNA (guanine527-N7)-methyltransferase
LESPIVDLGSGAGLPGIPVALAFPRRPVVLLEPRAKRSAFLKMAVEALRLTNVSVEKSSAGKAAETSLRGSAGTILVRALGSPAKALGLAVPLLREGGSVVLYLGKRDRPTSAELTAASRSGARFMKATAVDVPYLEGERHAWWFTKAGPRPKRPRN